MPYLLALDQGTTSSRAIVFDERSHIVALAQKEFRQIFPASGWVEHDPAEIWSSQISVAAEALTMAGISPAQVAAIGITNQRETTVVWDRETGEPVCNAIVWQDRRTAPLCEQLIASGADTLIRERTGLVVDAYFSATKLRWILDHVPGARQRAAAGKLAFGTIDTWLIWKLSGGRLHITDSSNASRTMLLNIHRHVWDDDLLALFDIPPSVLPQVRSSSEIYGDTSHPLLAGVPLGGIAGDQQAALFGQGCFTPGMAKNTYGTGCFLLMNTGAQAVVSRNRLLTTIAWTIANQTVFALEGSVFIGGAVVQWLRDGLGLIRSAAEIEALAASVPDSGGVYFVPAFAGLGAPHWDPYARGTIVGLSRGSTGAHLARAALESIALQVADIVDAMQSDSGVRLAELRVDGGAARNNLLLQIQADLLGVPTARPRHTETTALGAAYLAGLAAGVWKSQQQIATHLEIEARFAPSWSREQAAHVHSGWRAALSRAAGWAQPRTDSAATPVNRSLR